MKNVVIFGASGYLGAHISKNLKSSGFNVYGVCRRSIEDTQWQNYFVKIFNGDVTDESFVDSVFKEENYDFVLNLISLDHHKSNDRPSVVLPVNILTGWNILEACKKNKISRLAYLSTIQSIGDMEGDEISEYPVRKPKNFYGLTHSIMEDIGNFYSNNTDLQCVNIRLSNGYGVPLLKENDVWWLVINHFCKEAFLGRNITLNSSGESQRAFIHVDDIASAVKSIINTKEKLPQVINLGTGSSISIKDLAYKVKDLAKEILGKTININISKDNKDDLLLNKKFKYESVFLKQIGWNPKMDLDKGISDVFSSLNKVKYRID